MIPCLYASTETKFDNNGIGKMADAQSCIMTEKRNGSFELEMVCPADGIHAESLEEGNIILAKPSDTGRPQPFRIYKIATPIDGKLVVKARHISYGATSRNGKGTAMETFLKIMGDYGKTTNPDIAADSTCNLQILSEIRGYFHSKRAASAQQT